MTRKLEAGCWIDGHWGIYAIPRSIEIAQEYGFVLYEDDRVALAAFKEGSDFFEFDGAALSASDWVLAQGGLCDAAEEWLNENVAEEGHSFGWVDGEFFYMPQSWWEEEQ